MTELKKFYIEECLNKVSCESKARLAADLMEAMGLKSRMALYYRRKKGFTPRRGEDEKVLSVLKRYKVQQYLIEA